MLNINNFGMKIIRYFILAFAILFASKISAQKVMKLADILSEVEKNNPALQVFDPKIESIKSLAESYTIFDAPQFGAGVFMTPYRPHDNMGSFMLSGQQMLMFPTKISSKKKATLALTDVELDKKYNTLISLMSATKKAYYSSLTFSKKLKIVEENIEYLIFSISIAETRFKYNRESLSNIYRAKAQLEEMNNMKLMLENDIREQSIMINSLMYRGVESELNIDTSFVIKDYESWKIDSNSVENRSDIKGMEKSITAMNLSRDAEKNMLLPDFGVRYDHMSPFGTERNQYTLMAMVSLPIAPWSAKKSRKMAVSMDYQTKAMHKEKDDMERMAKADIAMLQTQISFKKKQVSLFEKSLIPAMQKSYEASLLAYQQNTGELYLVLDAIQMLNMKKLDYLDQINSLLQLQVSFENELEIK